MNLILPMTSLTVVLFLLIYLIFSMQKTQEELREFNCALKKDKIELEGRIRKLNSEVNQLQNELAFLKKDKNNLRRL